MPAPVKSRTLELKFADDPADFRWQMMFNAYSIDRFPTGLMVRFAWTYVPTGSSQPTTSEIVPIFVPDDGVDQLWQTSQKYIKSFVDVEPRANDILPAARLFSPMFANHIRMAYRGENAELSFFSLPMHAAAALARGEDGPDAKVHLVQVALLYSDLTTHKQFVMSLLKQKRET